MTLIRTVTVIIAIVVIGVIVAGVAADFLGLPLFIQEAEYSSKAASSTVYVQNGVSGNVTLTDPYQNRTVNISVSYDPIDSGSGVIITSDGYIITAYHVIGNPESEIDDDQLQLMDNDDIIYYLEEAAVNTYMTRYDPQLGNELITNNSNPNIHVTDDSLDNIVDVLNAENLINATNYSQKIMVKLPNTNNFLNASLVDVGNANTDEDIALLKVQATNLPTLSVSTQPTTGESLRIYGYPGNSTQSQYYNSTVSPSSSSGYLQSQMSDTLNTVYYEDSAPVSEGYSGGPVLDSQDNILGIVIYSVETQTGYKETSNSNSSVFLSSQYITQICRENNVPISTNS